MIYTAIDTFYLSDAQLANSPSCQDGIDQSSEDSLRIYGCELIQESGILLKLPQAVMATAQVLFHRCYCKKSFARFNVKRVAASCVWLAAKLEENSRKIQHVLNVFHRMECRRENKPLEPLDPFCKKYEELKIDLIRTERHLLKEMGFICHVEHPHKFILNYLSQLEVPLVLMQAAWNLANDSLRTTLSVRFKSEVVACGVVYATARRFKIPLPENPPWWKVFNAEKAEIDEVCRVLANLYMQPKAKYTEVGQDSKSFVLSSRVWDPPPDVQENLSKANTVNGIIQRQPVSSNSDGREFIVKVALDKLKSSTLKELRKPGEEAKVFTANGEIKGHYNTGKVKRSGDREDVVEDNVREKDRGRSKTGGRDRDREWDGDQVRDRIVDGNRKRDKDTERKREKAKDRYHWSKEKSKESGYSEKERHHSSSRDRDFQISFREKYRHHPYA